MSSRSIAAAAASMAACGRSVMWSLFSRWRALCVWIHQVAGAVVVGVDVAVAEGAVGFAVVRVIAGQPVRQVVTFQWGRPPWWGQRGWMIRLIQCDGSAG